MHPIAIALLAAGCLFGAIAWWRIRTTKPSDPRPEQRSGTDERSLVAVLIVIAVVAVLAIAGRACWSALSGLGTVPH